MSSVRPYFSRRRFLHIVAAAAAFTHSKSAVATAPIVWRGTALGALASIELYHNDPGVASRLIERSTKELDRLERIFSLYRAASSLSMLNRVGFLDLPPTDLVQLLSISLAYYRLTDGAFDPSVQVLWDLYSSHFSAPEPDPNGPAESHIQAALSRVGYSKTTIDADRVGLAPGMALTLNGIAQGYATDRVTDLLRSEGVEHALVDLGEMRLVGRHPDHRRWVVGVEDANHPVRISQTLELENCAVATSGGYGFRFEESGRFTHLFDPRTGRSPQLYKSVSVVSATATAADALSTAFSSMRVEEIRRVLDRIKGCKVYLTFADDTKQSL